MNLPLEGNITIGILQVFCLPFFDSCSSGNGTNRFLTVLFYLSEVALGGETIFPLAEEWWDENKNASVSNLDGWKRDR